MVVKQVNKWNGRILNRIEVKVKYYKICNFIQIYDRNLKVDSGQKKTCSQKKGDLNWKLINVQKMPKIEKGVSELFSH